MSEGTVVEADCNDLADYEFDIDPFDVIRNLPESLPLNRTPLPRPPRTRLRAQLPKTLVLDLDETLVHASMEPIDYYGIN